MTNIDSITHEIGSRVREVREHIRLSREELAEAAGLTVSFLTQIECGHRGMSLVTVIRISGALGVTTDYLLKGKKKSEDKKQLIYRMLESLSSYDQSCAEELLRVFILAVSNRV